MAKKSKKVSKVESDKQNDSKLFAFLAVLLSIVGFVIALIAKRDDKYVMYYAKQSLVLFIAWIIVAAIMQIPIIGWIIGVIYAIVWIFGLIYSLSGNMKPVPIIGYLGEKINL